MLSKVFIWFFIFCGVCFMISRLAKRRPSARLNLSFKFKLVQLCRFIKVNLGINLAFSRREKLAILSAKQHRIDTSFLATPSLHLNKSVAKKGKQILNI
jgi:hypothetical protein